MVAGTDTTSTMERREGSDPPDVAALEDGRTRCAWVRGRPEHYFFHDAEWGRLPDIEAPVFECVLLTCFQRGRPLVEVLDQRMQIHEASAGWDLEKVAEWTDADLDALTQRGGVFADRARLEWIRDVARSCRSVVKEFKGLREYFLAMPALLPDEQLADVCARFAGFGKEDAADLLQNLGCIGGSIQQWSHERDCWIY